MRKNTIEKLISVIESGGFECEIEEPDFFVYARHDDQSPSVFYVMINRKNGDLKLEIWHKMDEKNHSCEFAIKFDEFENAPLPENEMIVKAFDNLMYILVGSIKDSMAEEEQEHEENQVED